MDYLVSVTDLKVFGCSIDFMQTATQTYLEDPIWDRLQQSMEYTIVFSDSSVILPSQEQLEGCPIHHVPLAVHVPMNPEEIVPEGAFAGVPRLRHVSVESGIRLIEAEAWQNCGQLRIVKLPATVVGIFDNAFRDCKLLNSVSAPGCREFGYKAFAECCSLQWVYASDGVANRFSSEAKLGHISFKGASTLLSLPWVSFHPPEGQHCRPGPVSWRQAVLLALRESPHLLSRRILRLLERMRVTVADCLRGLTSATPTLKKFPNSPLCTALLPGEQNWSSAFSPFQSPTLASSIPTPPAHGSTCASSKTRSRRRKVVPSSLPPVPCPQFQFPVPSSLSQVPCPQFAAPRSLPVPCPSSLPPVPCPHFPVPSSLSPVCCPQFPAPQFPAPVPCPQFPVPSSLSQVPCLQFAAPSSLPKFPVPVPCPQFPVQFAAPSSLSQVPCPQFAAPSSCPPVPPQFPARSSLSQVPCLQFAAPSSLPKFPVPVPCPQFPVQFAAPSSLSQVPCPQFAAPSSLPPTSLSPVPCPKFPVPFLPPPRLEALHTAVGDQPRLRSTCRP